MALCSFYAVFLGLTCLSIVMHVHRYNIILNDYGRDMPTSGDLKSGDSLFFTTPPPPEIQ